MKPGSLRIIGDRILYKHKHTHLYMHMHTYTHEYIHIYVHISYIIFPVVTVLSSRFRLYSPFQFTGQSLLYKNSGKFIGIPYYFTSTYHVLYKIL